MHFDTHPASSIYEHQPEPDAWWGSDGIDSMAWADGVPYAELTEAEEAKLDTSEATP